MVVSDSRLARMQSVAARTMTDECLLERYTEASDGQGGTTRDWTVVGVVACRVAPSGRSATERIIADQLQVTRPYTVSIPAGEVVLPPDRLALDDATYQVVAPLERTLQIELPVVCERVD